MKNLIISYILLFSCICSVTAGQVRRWDRNGMEFGFGINQFPVKLSGGNGFKAWEALSFNLMQRFYADDAAMRAAIDFYILPATDYKYYVTGFGMGYARYFDIYYPNLRFFAGGDFRIQQEREEYALYSESDLRIGLLPNIGLQFRISPRVSFNTEVSYFLALRQRRTDATDPNSNDKNSSKIDFIGRQHRMLGLGFGFMF